MMKVALEILLADGKERGIESKPIKQDDNLIMVRSIGQNHHRRITDVFYVGKIKKKDSKIYVLLKPGSVTIGGDSLPLHPYQQLPISYWGDFIGYRKKALPQKISVN